MRRVLITRPTLDAERTAEKLAALGIPTLRDPMIEIEAVAARLAPAQYDALAFTSANAVRLAVRNAAADALRMRPVFAVGTHTAETARACGFADVANAAGDVNALAERMSAELPAGARVLYLAGADRAGDLAGRAFHARIRVETVVIYRVQAAAALKPETRAAILAGQIDRVLHYSERSAAAFVRATAASGITEAAVRLRHFCLSAAVAAPLRLIGSPVEIAARPDEAALFELLGV
jgi:uroporphyrinogen-III synthase